MNNRGNRRMNSDVDDRELQARVSIAISATKDLRMAIHDLMSGLVLAGHLEAAPYVKEAKRRSKSILNGLYRTAYFCWSDKSMPPSNSHR